MQFHRFIQIIVILENTKFHVWGMTNVLCQTGEKLLEKQNVYMCTLAIQRNTINTEYLGDNS